MMWRSSGCAVVVVLLSACTTTDADPGATTSAPATSTSVSPSQIEIAGRLVVLDPGGNVLTVDPDGSGATPITDDAGEAAVYAQPSWSPGGDRLAWIERSTDTTGVVISDAAGGDRSRVEMSSPPFYLNWAPDGSAIGVLHNGTAGDLELEIVDPSAGTGAVVARGAPLYFSWGPESDRLVSHVGGDTLALVDLTGATTDLGKTSAGYPAPHWVPTGILHLADGDLILSDDRGVGTPLAAVRGEMVLAANLQGTKVAIQSYFEEGGVSAALPETPVIPSNMVVVLDLSTGEVAELMGELSVGFFWSPDGEKLLVLDPTGRPGEVEALVWDGDDVEAQLRITLQPSFIRDVLQFFDQYSQSLRLWAPDSSAFALSGAYGENPGVWVKSLASADPVEVVEGSWAVWSGG